MIEASSALPSGIPCGLVRRGLCMLYDALIVTALWMLAAAIPLLAGLPPRTAGRDPGFTLYLIAVWFAYLDWCWRHGGITLGMRAWGVKLVTEDGRPLTWPRSLARFGSSLLSALLLGAGFAAALFDPGRRAWHDRLSGSRLLRNPRPEPVRGPLR